MRRMREAGLGDVPVVVGGIIPPADAEQLKAAGVAAVYTPKDFAINGILEAIVRQVEARHDAEQAGRAIPRSSIQPKREPPARPKPINARKR